MQDSGTAILNAAAQVRRCSPGPPRQSAWPRTSSPGDGAVHAPDGRSIGYGPLAAALALHVPASPSALEDRAATG